MYQPTGGVMIVKQQNNSKGTSKYHKTDEKSNNFAVHVPPSIFGIKNTLSHYTQNLFKNIVGYIYFKITNVDRGIYHVS